VNVVILGNFWFPRGTASAARIRNLALGLNESGARVHVITMAPHPPLDSAHVRGEVHCHEGISYESAAPTTAAVEGWRDKARSIPRLRSRLSDKVRWFAGLYGATLKVRRLLEARIARGQCDMVVAYDRSALRMGPVARLCRSRAVTSVLDVTEVSEHLGGSRLSLLYWDSLAGTRATPRLFDGVTLISTGLEALYRSHGCPRTLVLPAMEAWPTLPPPRPTGNSVFRLAYVGALQDRDAPEILLQALGILLRAEVPVALDVIGHYEGTARGEHFKRLCSADSDLCPAVRFLGSLGDRELSDRLASADGLVLTRRSAPTEELSFPTRLVEYLRCGRPVFTSAVGDASRYLEGGREAVFLDPSNPGRVAAAIAGIVLAPDRGAEIGCRGRAAGARAFDRTRHAARLLDFASELHRGGAA
jgi:glycosyltransferase involved in cell wall biosynthesis